MGRNGYIDESYGSHVGAIRDCLADRPKDTPFDLRTWASEMGETLGYPITETPEQLHADLQALFDQRPTIEPDTPQTQSLGKWVLEIQECLNFFHLMGELKEDDDMPGDFGEHPDDRPGQGI